jgi:hypothetical protein
MRRVSALLTGNEMNYGTPVCNMGFGLAFRSTPANIIIPNPSTMDATQRRVTVELLKKSLVMLMPLKKRERGCGGMTTNFR